MKLVDGEATVLVVTASMLEPEHNDVLSAELLRSAIDRRGGGHPYRRALVITDQSWFLTPMFRGVPTITIGGPGVNQLAAQFAEALPSVWTDSDRVMIQAEMNEAGRRAALWGSDRFATGEAVDAFINRGWLDEFLDRCWRFRAGVMA